MRERKEAHVLKIKAICSLKRASDVFNCSVDEGRATAVLLHLQHSFEMLLKAGLIQKNPHLVFDGDSGYTKGFKKCLNLAREHLGVSEEQIGVLRAIDQMRDHEQHFFADADESVLHLHCQAAIPIFDGLLSRCFGDRLADFLPGRVLPLSTVPVENFEVLIDRRFTQAKNLLQRGRRRGMEARAIVRNLLALEAHSNNEEFCLSEKEVETAVRSIKGGGTREQVLPGLIGLTTAYTVGVEQAIEVKFCRNSDTAMPVRYAGDDEKASAIRQVDWNERYPHSPSSLAAKLEVNSEKCKALRWKLSLDEDETCCSEWNRGKTRISGYSDKALVKLRQALVELNLEDVLREYRAARKSNLAHVRAPIQPQPWHS